MMCPKCGADSAQLPCKTCGYAPYIEAQRKTDGEKPVTFSGTVTAEQLRKMLGETPALAGAKVPALAGESEGAK